MIWRFVSRHVFLQCFKEPTLLRSFLVYALNEKKDSNIGKQGVSVPYF
jgi:hypothetical protein